MPKKRKVTPGVRRRRRRPPDMPEERWLFAHPSWLRNRWLPNAEKHGTQSLITGVFCVFVEKPGDDKDSVVHRDECKERCEALGWEWVFGVRFGHQTQSQWKKLLDRDYHAEAAQIARNNSGICLDMEPYGIKTGQRYHSGADAYSLFDAAKPWFNVSSPVYVYPPMFRAAFEILQGTEQPFALDHTTYNANKHDDIDASLALRSLYWNWYEVDYVPGFYLRHLNSAATMKAAAQYGRCFFFPQTSGGKDNWHKLFTPEWAPEAV